MKTGKVLFRFIVMYVRSLNYISAAINMFKWKWRGRGVWYISSVNKVRMITVAEVSCLMLSSTQLFAELPDLRRSVRRSSHSLPSLTREVQTTEDASLKCAYLVLRNMRRPNVKSPDYLPNLLHTKTAMETQTATGLGEKRFLGHIFPGHFGGKAACFTELMLPGLRMLRICGEDLSK